MKKKFEKTDVNKKKPFKLNPIIWDGSNLQEVKNKKPIEPISKMKEKKEKPSYKDLLKKPQWQRKRLEIMNRDNFACKYCGDDENELQIHHLKYNGLPWEANSEDLVTCCRHCHEFISCYKDNNLKIIYRDSVFKTYHVGGKIIIYDINDNKIMTIFSENSKILESIIKYKNG